MPEAGAPPVINLYAGRPQDQDEKGSLIEHPEPTAKYLAHVLPGSLPERPDEMISRRAQLIRIAPRIRSLRTV